MLCFILGHGTSVRPRTNIFNFIILYFIIIMSTWSFIFAYFRELYILSQNFNFIIAAINVFIISLCKCRAVITSWVISSKLLNDSNLMHPVSILNEIFSRFNYTCILINLFHIKGFKKFLPKSNNLIDPLPFFNIDASIFLAVITNFVDSGS